MHIEALAASAVKVSWERSECTLEIWWAASCVVPGIADLVASRCIEGERIAIAIKRSIERHSRIDTVVQRPFHYIRKLGIAGRRQHAPVPHHVSDRGATFSIGAEIGEFVSISKGLSLSSRTHSAADIHLRGNHVIPQRVQRAPIIGIAGLHVIVGRAAACVHNAHSVAFQLCTLGKWRSAKHVNRPACRKWSSGVALQNVSREI